MASQSPLGLPSIPLPLKAITPYLQRAQEVIRQDPVIAYWCAYYAAQVGISLKAKDPQSRDLLGALLNVLEEMKEKIGPHDAVDIEQVSSAYVENFGMKIFALADNEDRSGKANRATAKKFLAAANFLEILKTFPNIESSEGTLEKIKYAKWKAADIAKAFREGRQPTAGPAGAEVQQDHPSATAIQPPSPTNPIAPRKRSTSVSSREKRSSPTRSSHGDVTPPGRPRASSRASPPRIDLPDPSRHSPNPTLPKHDNSSITHLGVNVDGHERLGWGGEGQGTPGSWSTAATPGTGTQTPAQDWGQQPSPTGAHPTTGVEPTQHSKIASSGSSTRSRSNSNASGYPAGYPLPPGRPASDESSGSGSTQKSVRFTPSTVGDDGESSVAYSSAPTSPDPDLGNSDGYYSAKPTNIYQPHPAPPPSIDHTILPPGFVPLSHQPFIPTGVSPQPHVPSPQESVTNGGHAPSVTPPVNRRSPAAYPTYTPAAPQPPPSKTPSPVNELTPQIIAKAQKHCRFAISALDYEDAEQARKELRTALAILGGR